MEAVPLIPAAAPDSSEDISEIDSLLTQYKPSSMYQERGNLVAPTSLFPERKFGAVSSDS